MKEEADDYKNEIKEMQKAHAAYQQDLQEQMKRKDDELKKAKEMALNEQDERYKEWKAQVERMEKQQMRRNQEMMALQRQQKALENAENELKNQGMLTKFGSVADGVKDAVSCLFDWC